MAVQGNAPDTKEGRRDGYELQEPVIQVREEEEEEEEAKERTRKEAEERETGELAVQERDVEGGKKMKPEVAQANRSGANGQSFNEG